MSERFWQAMEERDTDLRGWVLAGVLTTGIYCVSGCPGRPKRANVRFFESTAAARAAGLRACKRCRPDEAMGDAIVVDLPHRAPLDIAALLEFFGRRAVPGRASRSSTVPCTGAACGCRTPSAWRRCARSARA